MTIPVDLLIAPINEVSQDGRVLKKLPVVYNFPVPISWTPRRDYAHMGAEVVGKLTEFIEKDGYIHGKGELFDNISEDLLYSIRSQVIYPSVDLYLDYNAVTEANGNIFIENSGLAGVTLVPLPAYTGTRITLTKDKTLEQTPLTAAVKTLKYDPELFSAPTQLLHDKKQYINYFDEATGRLAGYIAMWDIPHVSENKTAPKSRTNYSYFKTSGTLALTNGENMKVGRLIIAKNHAKNSYSISEASNYYADSGRAFALVNVGEDKYGIWYSGVRSPGVSDDVFIQGIHAPVSGDWRKIFGNLELISVMSVNTPGFPVLKKEKDTALVASFMDTQNYLSKKKEKTIDTTERKRRIFTEFAGDFLAM